MLISIKRQSSTQVSTAFSEFIRKASASEKKRVFATVLEKATEEQNRIIKEAKSV